MKIKTWLLPLAAAAALGAGASPASASVNWPASCSGFRCVNNHLNALHVQVHKLNLEVAALRRRNRALRSCLAEFPTTRTTTYDNWDYPYYNSSLANASEAPGFYNDQTSESQPINDLLQQTQNGGTVDFWFLRDTCTSPEFTRPPTP